jgi:hypothetical protein
MLAQDFGKKKKNIPVTVRGSEREEMKRGHAIVKRKIYIKYHGSQNDDDTNVTLRKRRLGKTLLPISLSLSQTF